MSGYSRCKTIFFCSLVAGLLVMAGTAFLLKNAYDTYQLSRVEYSNEVRMAVQSVEDNQWLSRNLQNYKSMQDRGIIGALDNLVWVDLLTSLYRDISIIDYQFEISPFSYRDVGNELVLQKADISIHGKIIHDGVLADLLSYLSENAPGAWFFSTMEVVRGQHAQISHSGEGNDNSRLGVFLKLTWVVIDRKIDERVKA